MGSVAEEGCVILVRDVCEMLADSTGGMSFAAHLAAYGRCLEHDAANALGSELPKARRFSGRTDPQTCSRSWRPYDPTSLRRLCSATKGTSFDPTWASQWTSPASSRIRDDRVQRDGAPGAPEVLIAARWGSNWDAWATYPTCAAGSAHRGGTRRDLRL
jgi:hypothetical protein